MVGSLLNLLKFKPRGTALEATLLLAATGVVVALYRWLPPILRLGLDWLSAAISASPNTATHEFVLAHLPYAQHMISAFTAMACVAFMGAFLYQAARSFLLCRSRTYASKAS